MTETPFLSAGARPRDVGDRQLKSTSGGTRAASGGPAIFRWPDQAMTVL
jgi:hypothetical protein